MSFYKKIRCISDLDTIEKFNWHHEFSGPGVGHRNDLFFLRQEDWLEIKPSNLEQSVKDDVIPWLRGDYGQWPEKLEKIDKFAFFGPNSCFHDHLKPELNHNLTKHKSAKKILCLNDDDKKRIIENGIGLDNARKVRHFMRPEIYETPLYTGPLKWDILFLVKGNIKMSIRHKFNNFTSLHNGWFCYEELVYKAQRSKACIVGSQHDTYGLAAHEINCYGCPLIVAGNGMFDGNMIEGTMGIKLKHPSHNRIIGSDEDELMNAYEKIIKWDRSDVRHAALEFHNPEKLKEIYRKAFFE